MKTRSYRVRRTDVLGAALLCAGLGASAMAQSSSLYRAGLSRGAGDPNAVQPAVPSGDGGVWAVGRKIDAIPPSTRVLERTSLIAVVEERPKPIQVHDLITIIVREQKKYESDAKSDNQKKWDVNSELSRWFRFYPDHRLGRDNLSNGNPGVKFKWDNKFEGEAQAEREDKFVTRITGEIIDVKPNGTVVIEARKHEKHDEEEITLTLTGTCRAIDITADNTVLSTQIHNLNIVETHHGSVRDNTRRGWIPRIVDFLRPF